MTLLRPLADEVYEEQGEAASAYIDQLWSPAGAEALEYLTAERGLTAETIGDFGLGFVAEPASGHEKFTGRIVIPYANARGITTLRYRKMPDSPSKAKYLDTPNGGTWLFNITCLQDPGSTVNIVEGEIDCMTAVQMGLARTVGISGATKFMPHWKNLLDGYATIRVLADNDDPGLEMAERIAREFPDAYVQIKAAPHDDVNTSYLEMGAEALLEHWDIDPEED